MSDNIIIRTYQAADADKIKQIAGDTANRGRPVETFFSDRSIVVDLLLDYYIKYEPQNLFIAEDKGQVVGYLSGCLFPQRFNWKISCCIIPKVFFQALMRGIFLKAAPWRLIKTGFLTLLKGGFTKHIPREKFPGHLHLNVKDGYRGQKIGERLMRAFLSYASSAGLKGVHAVVREDNITACHFFEKMGFQKLSRHPLIMPEEKKNSLGYTVVYAKAL